MIDVESRPVVLLLATLVSLLTAGVLLHAVLAAVAERAAGREVFLDAVRSGARSRTLEAWGLRVARSLERMLRPAVPGRAMLDERVVAATGFEWG